MPCGNRLKRLPWHGGVAHGTVDQWQSSLDTGPVIHTRTDHPRPQVQGAAFSDEGWKANIKTGQMSPQTFPPTRVSNIDVKQILEHWQSPYMGSFEKSLAAWTKEALVLHNMIDYIERATYFFTNKDSLYQKAASSPSSLTRPEHEKMQRMFLWQRKVEVVGITAGNLEISFLESKQSKVHASVFALCLFRREQLTDDSIGSILRALKEHRKLDTRPWLNEGGMANKKAIGGTVVRVFALEGLGIAPGIPEAESRVLLAKLEKYADKEKSIIMVPKWAILINKDGMNLSDYFVRLGFTQVVMEDGGTELVYTGGPLSGADKWVEDEQVMIGLNQLWTGL